MLVFARAPVTGRVKRRLAATLGEAAALAAYRTLLEGAIERCRSAREYRTELWLAGAPDPVTEALAARCGTPLETQLGADLGERMWHALSARLGSGGLPVLIGCDCPEIDSAYLRAAFRALATADVVIGPAEDGGYGLIGLARPAPALFRGLAWGGPDVLRDTLARAREAGLDVLLLDTVYDVDTAEDWARYTRSQAGSSGAQRLPEDD